VHVLWSACRTLGLLADGRPAQRLAAGPRVVVLRDRDTVAGLAARLPAARRVALVGNGGIALELAHALRGVEARGAPACGPCGGGAHGPAVCPCCQHGWDNADCLHGDRGAPTPAWPGVCSVCISASGSAWGAASRRALQRSQPGAGRAAGGWQLEACACSAFVTGSGLG